MNLSVLQWNVWFKEAADNVVALVREIDADVVCLQELTQDSTQNPGRDIPAELESLGYYSFYLPAHQRTGDNHIQMGNGIFSKFPIIGNRYVYVQHQGDDEENYSKENRVYLEVTLQIGETTITIGTVHLSYAPEFVIDTARRQEVDTLVAAIHDTTEHFVLTGDLNSNPNSYTTRELSKFMNSAGPDYSEPTWTTKPFAHNGFEATTLDWRLDYIFMTSDIKVLDSRILSTDYSDHLPILAKLVI